MKIEPIKTGSSGNLYIINTLNNNKYLLECGLNEKEMIKILHHKHLYVYDFKGCFISHIHSDHSKSSEWVNSYMPIYSNRQLMSKGYNGETLIQEKKKKFDDFAVIPFNVEHGDTENYGYIFFDKQDTILFITDFSTYMPNISNILFSELYIECNWTLELMQYYLKKYENKSFYSKYERQYNTHMGLDVLVELLEDLDLSNCKRITLIHPSDECCDKDLALETVRNKFPNIEVDFAKNERV